MSPRKLLSLLLSAATLALIAMWFVLLRPTTLGGPATFITVSGHSMEPTFYTGDLVILRTQASYHIGQVIVYHPPIGGQIIHRIIGGDAAHGFIMKGDNNPFPDPWKPTPSQIQGARWLYLKQGGRLLGLVRQPPILSTLIGGLAAFSLLGGERARRTRRARRRKGGGAMARATQSPADERLPAPLWMLVTGGALAALALVGLVGVVALLRQPARQTTQIPDRTYAQTATYTYTARMTPSALFPSGTLGPVAPQADGSAPTAPALPARLTNRLEVTLAYALQTAAPAQVSGDISATIEIHSGTSWTKTLPLLPTTAFSGTPLTQRFTLDLTHINALIATITRQTGLGDGSYEIDLVPTLHIAGQVGGQSITDTYSPTFQIGEDGGELTIKSALSQHDSHSSGRTTSQAAETSVLGHAMTVEGARGLWLATLIVGLLGLLALGGVFAFQISRDEVARIRLRYGQRLVIVTEVAPREGGRTLRLASMRDLDRLAKRDGGLIFYQRLSPTSHLFFIEDDQALYAYPVGGTREGAARDEVSEG